MSYYVYIMSCFTNTTVYTGVTNNLPRRVYQHQNGITEGFTSRYKVSKLVYYEVFDQVESAILREKQIKKYKREKKNGLICDFNPSWRDLYIDVCK